MTTIFNRPHKRIYLPGVLPNYVEDPRYSNNMVEQIRIVFLYERELIEIFNYVEPVSANMGTYSLMIYQLFMKCCIEFENICKNILEDNQSIANHPTIMDYWKLNNVLLLDKYACRSRLINNVVFQPLKDWANGYSLNWYQDYNKVKHNRTKEFKNANLKNLINSFCSLRIMLCAQYGELSLSNSISKDFIRMTITDDGGDQKFVVQNNSIFDIEFPKKDEYRHCYNFDWNIIKNDGQDFDIYSF